MLSHNTPTYGLTPYLDKHIKWGFIPYNNTVVNRVYDYPQWVKEVSREGMEDKWVVLKDALPSLCRRSSETLLYVHPRHKLIAHANETTADRNELV
jgi:hypothetical protein